MFFLYFTDKTETEIVVVDVAYIDKNCYFAKIESDAKAVAE
jgi:hypothetical protein